MFSAGHYYWGVELERTNPERGSERRPSQITGDSTSEDHDAAIKIKEISRAFEAWLSALAFDTVLVHPVRVFERSRTRVWPTESSLSPVLGERSQMLVSNLMGNRDHEDALSESMSELFGPRVHAELRGPDGQELWTRGSDRSANHPIGLEGSGTNQLTQLLVGMVEAHSSGVPIIIEEPEVHLHPRMQYDVGSMLVESVGGQGMQVIATTHSEHVLHPRMQYDVGSMLVESVGGQGMQVIATTHSEHVLHAVLNGIAEGDIEADQVVILETARRDGADTATVNVHRPSADGQLPGGLPGFMQQHVGELKALIAAIGE